MHIRTRRARGEPMMNASDCDRTLVGWGGPVLAALLDACGRRPGLDLVNIAKGSVRTSGLDKFGLLLTMTGGAALSSNPAAATATRATSQCF